MFMWQRWEIRWNVWSYPNFKSKPCSKKWTRHKQCKKKKKTHGWCYDWWTPHAVDEHEFWPIYSSNLILMCGVSQAQNYSHRTYPFFEPSLMANARLSTSDFLLINPSDCRACLLIESFCRSTRHCSTYCTRLRRNMQTPLFIYLLYLYFYFIKLSLKLSIIYIYIYTYTYIYIYKSSRKPCRKRGYRRFPLDFSRKLRCLKNGFIRRGKRTWKARKLQLGWGITLWLWLT